MDIETMNRQQICKMGENIRRLREIRGYTVEELAKMVNMPVNTLRSLENGTPSKRCVVDYFLDICELFGVHPQTMFF